MFKRVIKLKKRQVAVLWLLVVVLVLPLILFFHIGLRGSSRPGPGGAAGELFGHAVPWEAFEQEYRMTRRAAAQQFGRLPDGVEGFLRQQTWERLMLQEEARRRIRITDEELARHLQSQPTFQQAGRFVPEVYFHFIRGLGLSAPEFEDRVRDDLRIQRLLERVRGEVTVTDEETAQAYARTAERVRAKLVVVRFADVSPQAARAVTNEDVQAYYAAHQPEFQRPALRTLEAVGLSAAEATAQQPKPTDAQVRQRLTGMALDLQEDVEQGLTLEQMSAARGLAVRRVGPLAQDGSTPLPGGLHPSMLRAIFDTPVGRLSAVQQTAEGVYVFRPVTDTPAMVPPLEQVRDEARRAAVEAKARELARTRADDLRGSLLKPHEGATLEQAAAALHLTALSPEPITRQDPIPSVGAAPQINDALFALTPGTLSAAMDAPEGIVVGWITERLPASPDDIAQHREAFRPTLLATKQQEHLAAWVDELRRRARLQSFLESREGAGATR